MERASERASERSSGRRRLAAYYEEGSTTASLGFLVVVIRASSSRLPRGCGSGRLQRVDKGKRGRLQSRLRRREAPSSAQASEGTGRQSRLRLRRLKEASSDGSW